MIKPLPKKRPIPFNTIVVGVNEIDCYKRMIDTNCTVDGQKALNELIENHRTDFSKFLLAVVQLCERRASWDDVKNEMGRDYAVDIYGPRP